MKIKNNISCQNFSSKCQLLNAIKQSGSNICIVEIYCPRSWLLYTGEDKRWKQDNKNTRKKKKKK